MCTATINDFSFIIVARNEKYSVDKCLRSVVSLALVNCEVICVDSGSSDSTLTVMKSYAADNPIIEIFQCQGYSNSAVARNVGLNHATKEYVFFVDGDVELSAEFVRKSLDMLSNKTADAVTGRLREIYYNDDYSTVLKTVEDRFHIKKQKKIYHSGGCFVTRNSVIRQVGRWDERMTRNQDIDYTLRLSRIACFCAIPISMGTHHSRIYPDRTLQFLRKRYPIYFGILLRKNIDRPLTLVRLMANNTGFLWGAAFCAFTVFLLFLWLIDLISVLSAICLLFVLVACDFVIGHVKKQNITNRFVSHYIYLPLIMRGLLFRLKKDRPTTVVSKIVPVL